MVWWLMRAIVAIDPLVPRVCTVVARIVCYTDIQLRVQDGLCHVDPDDVLSDLVTNDGQVFILGLRRPRA